MAAQGHQVDQGMGGRAGGMGAMDQRMVQKGVQVLEQGGFFLTGTGSGGTTWRERTR